MPSLKTEMEMGYLLDSNISEPDRLVIDNGRCCPARWTVADIKSKVLKKVLTLQCVGELGMKLDTAKCRLLSAITAIGPTTICPYSVNPLHIASG